jgi:hypothetical protein
MANQRAIRISDPRMNTNNMLPATAQAQLMADPSMRHWFEARTGLCTLDTGNILSFDDWTGTAAKLTRHGPTQHAALAAGSIGLFESALFDQTQLDRYNFGGVAQPDFSQPFSWFLTFKFDDTAINKNICGTFTSGTARAIVVYDTNTNAVSFKFNGASMTIPVSRTAWNALLVSYDGTRIRGRANGVEPTPITITGSPGTATFNLGSLSNSQYWDGWIKHCVMFDGDTLADPVLVEGLEDVAGFYGLTF